MSDSVEMFTDGACKGNPGPGGWGVLMIYKQLFDVLQKHGLKVIDETGVHFDPNLHEGVIREEDPSVPSHTVTAVLQKGYFLHDRLLRPAMVKVAVGGPDQPA